MKTSSAVSLVSSLFALVSFAGLTAIPANAQIDPGMLPVAGTWAHGGHDTVAWVDLATWTLVTSVQGAPLSSRFAAQPRTWMPVAGDWDGDGVDSIQMFNLQDWRLVPADRGPLGDSAVGDPIPWTPVAGDWDGDGIDTVLVFDQRNSSLHRLEEGPIPVEGYDPEPNPWIPVAGDWDGHRIDILATLRLQEPRDSAKAAWTFLSGDWNGDGIDTDVALHLPSGQLVFAEEETALRSVAGIASSPAGKPSGLEGIVAPSGGGGQTCYKTISDWNQWVKVVHYGVGGCTVILTTTWLEWTCCKISQNGWEYACGSQLKIKVHVYGYSNC